MASSARQIDWFSAFDDTPAVTLSAPALARVLKILAGARNRFEKREVFQTVRLTASGGTVSLTARCEAAETRVRLAGDVVGSLDTLVPWTTMNQLAKTAGPITFRDERAETTVGQYTWDRCPVTHWPGDADAAMESPTPETSAPVVLDAATLRRHLHTLRTATAPRWDSRTILTGILIDPGHRRCVATDGTHLIRTSLPGPLAGSPLVIAPEGVAALLAVLGPTPRGTITWHHSVPWIVCRYDTADAAVRLLEGRYPDINRLFPETYPAEATVAGRDLASALARVGAAARDVRGAVLFITWEANGLVVSTDDSTPPLCIPVPGQGQIPLGESLYAAFYPENLTVIGKTLDSGPVRCQYSGREWPTLFTQGDVAYLILPQRF